ncbi:amino acid permease [Acetobacterium paludosum]|uniref:Amino acid permease n=1 Tax=Acetobacterium paludosum TaxID=52693 RepID=A0A923KSF2_9FIRM|nr:amino acid permease [Acetobacterium paludosum]MBC3888307.1 amino acid permease [Acetobacterium paludosum]
MKRSGYNLFTAIALIVGIVVGSGIFFKSDNILIATNGNVFLGILIFVVAAISIVFGCLTIAELAARTDLPGGILTYAKEFISPSIGCAYGWFQTFIYLPTITAILIWVSGIYFCILFNVTQTLEIQILSGICCFFVFYIINILSAKIGGEFQSIAMIIKLLPLIVIGIVGLIFGGTGTTFANDALSQVSSTGWLGAIAPIAFSFDGWIISTTVAYEIKNSKRNLPLALSISPLIILVLYVIYFVGISNLVGPTTIMKMGDAHLDFAANMIFGPSGAKIVMLFVFISVLGTLNGLVMGMIRLPYALGLDNMIPKAAILARISPKVDFPVNSALFSLVLIAFWMVVHYFTQKFALFPNSDISEIAIVTSYLLYLGLYYKVFILWKKKEIKSLFRGLICPIFASIGSLIIFSGGLQNPLFGLYLSICLIAFGSGYAYYRFGVLKKKIQIK